MTREEHLKWCKERAIKEFDFYDKQSRFDAINNGMTSMMSDLGKHPETQSSTMQSLCMMTLMSNTIKNRQDFVNFINGFN